MIDAAIPVFRDGGHEFWLGYAEDYLRKAQAIRDKLG